MSFSRSSLATFSLPSSVNCHGAKPLLSDATKPSFECPRPYPTCFGIETKKLAFDILFNESYIIQGLIKAAQNRQLVEMSDFSRSEEIDDVDWRSDLDRLRKQHLGAGRHQYIWGGLSGLTSGMLPIS